MSVGAADVASLPVLPLPIYSCLSLLLASLPVFPLPFRPFSSPFFHYHIPSRPFSPQPWEFLLRNLANGPGERCELRSGPTWPLNTFSCVLSVKLNISGHLEHHCRQRYGGRLDSRHDRCQTYHPDGPCHDGASWRVVCQGFKTKAKTELDLV